MKKLILLALLFSPLPAFSQQQNVYSVCTEYVESYIPGHYDGYGNYHRGRIETREQNVPCKRNRKTVYHRENSEPIVRRCGGAARTTIGGLLGGGAAAALSKKDAYGWSVPLGAVLGMGVGQSICD